MDPDDLCQELRGRGLAVLGVTRHHTNPDVLVVYLHGLAGQWANGYARSLIAVIPGVLAAAESVQSSAILLVRLRPPTAQ